ncbi:ribonuclease [Microbacterium mangrovi]|uniref:Ribonuclease VapC n=1 Tax=Microbacterium mangrovi TaxID=1348253 RepID=A0A0B2ADB8_9MICO|nr:TA system VapC family ribonuclease toxin [Microbacterium mangrovi]KHK99807.1 ribonuclease [Microbacterium mangrovi]
MTSYLLDANVLIALTIREHVHFRRASRWFGGIETAAVCPVTEGALMRYAVRIGVSPSIVKGLITALRADPRIEFWPDELSYEAVDLRHVVGHRQVTDAYLASLAVAHDSVLATMDDALHATLPHATLLIPD